jgi:membrane protein
MDSKRAVKAGKALVTRQREHNVSLVAAGLAFYGMLTLIPAMVALVSIYGLVSDPAEVTEQITDLTKNLPVETARFVQAQLTSVANGATAGLGISALVAIALALWSTSGAMAALIKAIGIAWADTTKRSIVQIRGAALAMTIVTVIAVALTIGLVVVIPQVVADAGTGARLAADAVRWLATFGLTVVALP